MIDLPGIPALQGMTERVSLLHSSVVRLGDPGRIAGDPEGIRRLAEQHRASAARLDAVAMSGRIAVSRVLVQSWRGEACDRFACYWSDVERRFDALVAAHRQTADHLDQISEESAHLNREVTDLSGTTESWLRSAHAALSALDPGSAGLLVSEGMTLVVRWERLLREVEVMAESVARRLPADLGFARRPVAMRPRSPDPQPRINVPRQPGRGLLAHQPDGPASPMTDRYRRLPGGRREPVPPPYVRLPRGRFPPASAPGFDRPGPKMPGPRRPRTAPPSGPVAGTGVGNQPRNERGTSPPRAGTPVKVPPTLIPGHVATVPHHDPAMGTVTTPIDAYIFQWATIGVLSARGTAKLIRRWQERKKGGSDRPGRK